MSNGMRGWLRAAVAVAVVLVGTAIAYRVLAPAEVLSPATEPYPAAVATVPPGVTGTLPAAPLIVDGRLRVFATTRQVRTDRPVQARTQQTPYWSYRRWPAQLSGVAATGATVVTRWSDGAVVALDARTGRVRWRAPGPRPDRGYAGGLTGAATLYAPAGLHIATDSAGRGVVIVVAPAEQRGIDLDSGRDLWRTPVGTTCRSGGFTTTDGRFGAVDTCASPQAVEFRDVGTGAPIGRWRPDDAGPVVEVTPVGCAIGRSACAGLRTTDDGGTRGWLIEGSAPVAAPALDPPDAWLIGAVVVNPAPGSAGGELIGRSARTGAQLWRWTDRQRARVVATQPGRVHLLASGNELVTLAPDTGVQLSRIPLTYGRETTDWSPGYVYAGDGFVAVERLARSVRPGADDRRHYVGVQPVILART